MTDVAIVGAGVVGALIGRELMKYQLSVTIVEKESDVAVGATKANSSIVHAGYDVKPGTLKARLNVAGSELMPKVAGELGVKYQNIGALVVAFQRDQVPVVQALVRQGQENGVAGICYVDAVRLRELEPNIAKNALGALYAPTSAIVSPYGLCIAAAGNALDNGGRLLCGFEVAGIEKITGGWKLTAADGRVIAARYLVNAAGVYADAVAAMAGDRSFTIRPRRGEYLLLDRDPQTPVRHTLFRPPTRMGKGILVTPSVDGNIILGPTAEDIADKDDKSTTAEGLQTVAQQAAAMTRALNLRGVITSFAGLRAVGGTGDFIINSPFPGFVNVAAIESPGLSCAPAIAEYVVSLLAGLGLELKENRDFNPYRPPTHGFSGLSMEEKNERIQQDPRYGRVICRCESVTEGEIVRVIHQNPRPADLDGLKRRLRTGMGRCQGGFCTPLITEILARELGVSEWEITKSGAGSRLLTGRAKA